MKVNIQIEDPEIKERENAFWMAVLSYVEPVFLWFVIRFLMDLPLFGGWSIGILVGLVVVRFVYPVRLVVYPLLWGLLVYHFSKGTLLPAWLDWLAILMVVGGRFWFLFSEK